MKNSQIHIRIEEETKKVISDKAKKCGKSISDFMISCSLDKKLIVIDQVSLFDGLRELSKELNYIGNNLNQYIKLLNMLKKVNGVNTEAMVNIEKLLKEQILLDKRVRDDISTIKDLFI